MSRLVVHELVERPGTTKEIATLLGVSDGEVLVQLRELNDRLRVILGQTSDPLTATGSGAWKADGVAGLLRLNPQIEIEVVPKFLDPSSSTWRADFFVLATLVRTGHLLICEELSAGVQERGGLATLIARSLLDLCAKNERRPIRAYRRAHRSDFALDGDVDWESTFLPDPDGFAVSSLELTRQNPYNATLAAAVRILIPEVSDADTLAQLHILRRVLGPQPGPPAVFAPLPSRHQVWEQPYDLAAMIVQGLGLNLDEGLFSGPGFIISTWSAWESLCEEIVRRAMPNHRVLGQKQWALGYRGADIVWVTPDISPLSGTAAPFLLDAKYKTRRGRTPSINSGDLYESLAFLRGSKAEKIRLLYPALQSIQELPLGDWRQFDHVEVEQLVIEAYEVQVQGLSQRGGFDELIRGTKAALLPLLAP